MLERSQNIFTVMLLIISFSSPVSGASDLEREARLKNQIIDAILDGEPHMLEANGHRFLGIYTEAEDSSGAVVILHGRGFHPDWIDVVSPLRVGLVEYGWNTLSIQLPVLAKEAKYYDYEPVFDDATPRIDAALDFLQQQGNKKIIIIAHSCGVHMAMQYVRNKGEKRFHAFVGIGMGATDYKQPMRRPLPIERMKNPVLDVFGGADYPAVHRLAGLRAQHIEGQGHALSEQVKVPGANHYFTDMGEPLLETIAGWLEKLK
jgi:pimeloyl-ACP methyl ester carboxylesterase